uniref:Putative secreted protein n=1 Tax=Ixodes ricinus TaxID=34613 RepID=A0A6B0UMP0_IXORI
MARAVLLLAHPLLSLAQTLLELVQLGKQPPPGVALRHLGNSLMMMAASWTRKDVGALPAFPRAGYPVMARHHRMLQGSPPRQASPAGTARKLRSVADKHSHLTILCRLFTYACLLDDPA